MLRHRTYDYDRGNDGHTVISNCYHNLTSYNKGNERPANVRDILENDLHLLVSCSRHQPTSLGTHDPFGAIVPKAVSGQDHLTKAIFWPKCTAECRQKCSQHCVTISIVVKLRRTTVLTVEENTDDNRGLHRELEDDRAKNTSRERASDTITTHPNSHHVEVRNVSRAISFWSRLHAMSFDANLGEEVSVIAI